MDILDQRDYIVSKIIKGQTFKDKIYYVALVIFLLAQFSTGTMVYEYYLDANFPYKIIMVTALAVSLKIILLDNFKSIQELLVYITIGVIIWSSCDLAKNYDIFYYYIFIIGARNVELKKIIKIFLWTIFVGLIITVVSAKLGFITGLTNSRTGSAGIRYALGTVYPTDLAARTFYLQLMYVVLRKFKLTLPEYIAGFAFSIMMYIITDTRVDFILMIATLLLALGYKYVVTVLEFLGTKVLMLLGLLASFGMIILSYLYTPKIGILRFLDKLLSTRLQNGHVAFEDYNVTVMGQYIFQQGNGGIHNGPFHYFFIDCTFLRVLMMMGIVVFVIFMVSICYMLKRFMDKQAYVLVIALILIVVSSLIDHHMTELSFDIIFLAMFSNIEYFSKYSKNKSLFSI